MSRYLPITFLLLLIFCTWTFPVQAGKFNRVLNIGDAAPAWGDLKSVDGRALALSDFAESSAIVVVFFANRCPVSQLYSQRLSALADDFRDRKVAVVAISVSHSEADQFEAMQIRSRQQQFRFEYLQDLSQESARRFGATCTPHAFVLDRERKIAYMGAIDDNFRQPDQVAEPYLRLALDALLKGEKPEIRETRQTGCDIEFVSPSK